MYTLYSTCMCSDVHAKEASGRYNTLWSPFRPLLACSVPHVPRRSQTLLQYSSTITQSAQYSLIVSKRDAQAASQTFDIANAGSSVIYDRDQIRGGLPNGPLWTW